MSNKQPYGLDPNTPLNLIAIHKTTGETFEKQITYGAWTYKCYKLAIEKFDSLNIESEVSNG